LLLSFVILSRTTVTGLVEIEVKVCRLFIFSFFYFTPIAALLSRTGIRREAIEAVIKTRFEVLFFWLSLGSLLLFGGLSLLTSKLSLCRLLFNLSIVSESHGHRLLRACFSRSGLHSVFEVISEGLGFVRVKLLVLVVPVEVVFGANAVPRH